MLQRVWVACVVLLCVIGIAGYSVTTPHSQASGNRATAAITVSQISSGRSHVCALFSNGTIKCWGYNEHGQLGYGDTVSRGRVDGFLGSTLPTVNLGTGVTATKVVASEWYTCALLNTKQVKCWGWNRYGELGRGDTETIGDDPDEMGDHLPVVSIGTARSAVDLVAGTQHACVLLDNNAVKCWGQTPGNGESATIGDGADEMGDNLAALNFGTTETVTQLVAGGSHSCVLLSNGGVKCWGNNFAGKLGTGSTNSAYGTSGMGTALASVSLGTRRYATQLALGENSTCALLDNGTVKCWGSDWDGQIGGGSTDDIGDTAAEMGDGLAAVDLGTNRTVKTLYAGYANTCAKLDTGAVKCWGYNDTGDLGDGTLISKGKSSGQMGDALAAMNFGGSLVVKQFAMGAEHTCALFTNGGVKCWGINNDGQAGCLSCNWYLTPLANFSYVNMGTTPVTLPTFTKTKSPTRTRTSTRTLTASKTFTPTKTATASLSRTPTLTKTPTP